MPAFADLDNTDGRAHDVQTQLQLIFIRGLAVRSITIFDRYQGSSLVAGTYSLAFALLLQDAGRTLTDTEVQAEMDRLLVAVRQLGSIELRA